MWEVEAAEVKEQDWGLHIVNHSWNLGTLNLKSSRLSQRRNTQVILDLKHCIQGGHPSPCLNRGAILISRERVENLVWNIVEIQDCLFLLVIISTCHCCCLILSSCILSNREQASWVFRNILSTLPSLWGPDHPSILCLKSKCISILDISIHGISIWGSWFNIFFIIQNKLTVWNHNKFVLLGHQNFWGAYNKRVELK